MVQTIATDDKQRIIALNQVNKAFRLQAAANIKMERLRPVDQLFLEQNRINWVRGIHQDKAGRCGSKAFSDRSSIIDYIKVATRYQVQQLFVTPKSGDRTGLII